MRTSVSVNPKWADPAAYIFSKFVTKGDYEALRWLESERRHCADAIFYMKSETLPVTSGNTPAFTHSGMAQQILEHVAPFSLFSRFLPVMRRLPFALSFPAEATATAFAWVGENRPIPALRPTYNATALPLYKLGCIVATSKELTKRPGATTESSIFQQFTRTLAKAIDINFFDPSVGLSVGVEPASITNAGIVRVSSGSSATQILSDLQYMIAAMADAGCAFAEPSWVMRPSTHAFLCALLTSGGQRAFPELAFKNGTLLGLPVATSTNLQGIGIIALVDFSDIAIADDGGLAVDRSEQASLVMSTTPESSPQATSLVSLFQNNLVGLRAIREISWLRAHSYSASYMSVSY